MFGPSVMMKPAFFSSPQQFSSPCLNGKVSREHHSRTEKYESRLLELSTHHLLLHREQRASQDKDSPHATTVPVRNQRRRNNKQTQNKTIKESNRK